MKNPMTVIVAQTVLPCVCCGRPTNQIDYCDEVRICPPACNDTYWRNISKDCGEEDEWA